MTYQHPVHTTRPSKSHRFDFYSPKLGRPITLFSYPQLNQWTLLEAFPAIETFCERTGGPVEEPPKVFVPSYVD